MGGRKRTRDTSWRTTAYHSKYNRIERCWGILENHWNGALLSPIATTFECAKTMTWRRVRPIVQLLDRVHQTGAKLTTAAFRPVAARLKRSRLLPLRAVRSGVRPDRCGTASVGGTNAATRPDRWPACDDPETPLAGNSSGAAVTAFDGYMHDETPTKTMQNYLHNLQEMFDPGRIATRALDSMADISLGNVNEGTRGLLNAILDGRDARNTARDVKRRLVVLV